MGVVSGFLTSADCVDFSLFSGESFDLQHILSINGVAFDCTTLTAATLLVKEFEEDSDADAVLTYAGAQMLAPNGATDRFIVRFPATDTASLNVGGVYWYELRISINSGESFTVLVGRLFVNL